MTKLDELKAKVGTLKGSAKIAVMRRIEELEALVDVGSRPASLLENLKEIERNTLDLEATVETLMIKLAPICDGIVYDATLVSTSEVAALAITDGVNSRLKTLISRVEAITTSARI